MGSRGSHISAYSPAFNPNDGAAAVTSAQISAKAIVGSHVRMTAITSAVANSGVVYGLTHGLGATPSIVIFVPRGTVGQLKAAATSASSVGAATVSAHTSAKVYYAGAKNSGFTAYIIV